MKNYLCVVFVTTIFLGCKTQEKTVSTETEKSLCNVIAHVEDYSALDGCGKILIAENGDKILPMDPSILAPYQVKIYLKVGFRKIEGAVSTCMAENFIADIICLEETNIPMPKKCIDAHTVDQLSWQNINDQKSAIESIIKYSFLGDGWSYIISFKDEHREVYNCQGDLLCQFEEHPDPSCQRIINEMTYLNIIYGKIKDSK